MIPQRKDGVINKREEEKQERYKGVGIIGRRGKSSFSPNNTGDIAWWPMVPNVSSPTRLLIAIPSARTNSISTLDTYAAFFTRPDKMHWVQTRTFLIPLSVWTLTC